MHPLSELHRSLFDSTPQRRANLEVDQKAVQRTSKSHIEFPRTAQAVALTERRPLCQVPHPTETSRPAFLVLDRLEPLQLRFRYPAVLPLLAVEGVERHPMPPDHFLQNRHDLLIGLLPPALHGST